MLSEGMEAGAAGGVERRRTRRPEFRTRRTTVWYGGRAQRGEGSGCIKSRYNLLTMAIFLTYGNDI
jgi:hypothetical protein